MILIIADNTDEFELVGHRALASQVQAKIVAYLLSDFFCHLPFKAVMSSVITDPTHK